MTTQTKTPPTSRRRNSKNGLGQLPDELLEAIDKARGDTVRDEWIAETLRDRVEKDKQDAEPVEDLDEAPKRATIRYRKRLYELRNISEFGPIEQHGLNRDGQEFAEIWQSREEITEDDAKGQRLLLLTDRLLDKVLDAPDDIRSQLTEGEKARVVLAFTVAPAKQLAQLAQLIQQVAQQPGNESV